jgi:phosphocarrier protein FPr
MVSIVIVAHSAALAEGARELALQMAQGKVLIAAAGGVEDPQNPIGTDALRISSAIQSVFGDDGVLVISDLGSALLSTETAIDLLPAHMRRGVRLSAAPLVEGAVVAAVQAALGSPIDQVEAEARRALEAKAMQVGGQMGAEATRPTQSVSAARQIVLTVRNPLGLHARPAALFVATAARFPAAIAVRNLSRSRGPADAKSINQLAILGVRQGDQIHVTAVGASADRAIGELEALVAANFGEADDAKASRSALPSHPLPRPSPNAGPGRLLGIPASPGVAVAPAHIYERATYDTKHDFTSDADLESHRLEAALDAARQQVQQVRERALEVAGPAEAKIFDAHLLCLDDPELAGKAQSLIFGQRMNADSAWAEAVDSLVTSYEALPDLHIRARAVDIIDVGRRVSALLASAGVHFQPKLSHPAVVIAADLTPSDVAQFDPALVRGMCTALGGPNSHSSILARAMGIPSVVGLGLDALSIPAGTMLIVDGSAGEIHTQPTSEEQNAVRTRIEAQAATHRDDEANCQEPAITRDGHRIAVFANAGSVQEVRQALRRGAEGIGVLRTEFLFLGRQTAPTEREQAEVYAAVLDEAGSRPVIVRTLDVGGDKPLPYLSLSPEANPFLGRRGLRLSLAFPDLLRTQLRALLRAKTGPELRIMFPMVTTLEELREGRRLLREVVEELHPADGHRATQPLLGIMAEVPSTAVLIDHFAREVDFVSIGTNDLTQYVLAAERGNENVARLGDGCNPAVLRLVSMIADGCREAGIKAAVCGEIAAEPEAIPLLLGLGIDELSMSPTAIPHAKAVVRKWSLADARELARQGLQLDSAEAVRELVKRYQLGRSGQPEQQR